MPYDTVSRQIAAFIGDDHRWGENFEEVTIDTVWERIEAGGGQTLPHRAVQFADSRCHRHTVGGMVEGTFATVLDADEPKDSALRDRFVKHDGARFSVTFRAGRRSKVSFPTSVEHNFLDAQQVTSRG